MRIAKMAGIFHSNATDAKEFRQEVIDYFKMRLALLYKSNSTGKDKKAELVLIDEFKHQISFWGSVKIGDETIT
jgi:hypothetical protein